MWAPVRSGRINNNSLNRLEGCGIPMDSGPPSGQERPSKHKSEESRGWRRAHPRHPSLLSRAGSKRRSESGQANGAADPCPVFSFLEPLWLCTQISTDQPPKLGTSASIGRAMAKAWARTMTAMAK